METDIPALQGIAVLLLIGFLMIAAEVFVPGMVLGIVGALCLACGVAWTYAEYGIGAGTAVLAGVGLFGTAAFFVYMSAFPKTFIGKQIINKRELGRPGVEPGESLLGQSGCALTILRPSGTAKIGGRRVDVVAESNFIDAGEPVTVIQVEGNRVVVRKTP